MKKRIISVALALIMCLALVPLSALAANRPAPSPWAADEVKAAISKGLVPTMFEYAYSYTEAITRAQFAELAVRLYEKFNGPISGRVKFVDTVSAYVDVEKVAFIGVASGVGDNKFNPDGKLTREQATVMLSNLADALEAPLPGQAAAFADSAQISSWAIDGVGKVQAGGIMSGVDSNNFSPKTSYTREQSIITMSRLHDAVWKAWAAELSEESVYDAMMAMKTEYPEGMRWTTENTYTDNNGVWGAGCSAFAGILSDAAFGNLPYRWHADLDDIRVGDSLAYPLPPGPGHVVVVLKVEGDNITIAEGNAGSAIHWERAWTVSCAKDYKASVCTRWPE